MGEEDPSSLGNPQVRHSEHWPFKFSLEDNRWYVNKARRRARQAKQEQHWEDAPF